MAQSRAMYFELISEISKIDRIARGPSVRDRARLRKKFGETGWTKLKAVANVRLANGEGVPVCQHFQMILIHL